MGKKRKRRCPEKHAASYLPRCVFCLPPVTTYRPCVARPLLSPFCNAPTCLSLSALFTDFTVSPASGPLHLILPPPSVSFTLVSQMHGAQHVNELQMSKTQHLPSSFCVYCLSEHPYQLSNPWSHRLGITTSSHLLPPALVSNQSLVL